MHRAHGYFELTGFLGEDTSHPHFLVPIYTDGGKDSAGSEMYMATCDDFGNISSFESIGRQLPPEAWFRSAPPDGVRLYKSGDPACFAIALNEGTTLSAAGWARFCERTLRTSGHILLQANPLIGLGLAEAQENDSRALDFAVGSLLQLRTFDLAVMDRWRRARHFSETVSRKLDDLYPSIQSGSLYLGPAPELQIPRMRRVGVFETVQLQFPIGVHDFGGQAFRFERIPVSGMASEQFKEYGFVIARSYNFIEHDYDNKSSNSDEEVTYRIASVNGVIDNTTREYLYKCGATFIITEYDRNYYSIIRNFFIGFLRQKGQAGT